MRGYSRGLAPGLPLVSISVSFVALRFLSWAESRGLVRKSGGDSAFAGQAFADRRQYLPWVQAVSFNEPLIERRPPRVMNLVNSRAIDHPTPISASLWRDSQFEALRCLHHPWTIGLADGSTNRNSFKRYVAQDAYFLRAFAKAYAGALMKVEDEESIRAFHSLIGSVLDELKLHASYATNWGIDIKNVPPPIGATSEYVHFLLNVASDPASSVAQVLATMAPCMRLYAFLGKELQRGFPNWGGSAYAEWIETYGSEEFEAAARLVESLLDKYSTEGDYWTLLTHYRQAMELEYAFFAAQNQETAKDDRPDNHHGHKAVGSSVLRESVVEKSVNRGYFEGVHQSVALLCIDFDDTLTDGDTTSLLVKTAAAQRNTMADQARVDSEWARLTNKFQQEWREVMEESLSQKGDGRAFATSLDEAVAREGLEMMLRKLEKVDLDSVNRVAESKVLRGVTRESIRASLSVSLRSSWSLRAGVPTFISRASMSQFQTHVLSINWSRDLITSVLSETLHENLEGSCFGDNEECYNRSVPAAMSVPGDALGHFDDDGLLPVSCNDLVYDEHGVSTGNISVNYSAAFGKRKRFLDLASAARGTSRNLTIYVGDSVTDLLAMLGADVGILVGNSTSFERVASTFGVSIRPLVSVYEALRGRCDGFSRPLGSIYRVAHWAEIEVFLFGDSRQLPLRKK